MTGSRLIGRRIKKWFGSLGPFEGTVESYSAPFFMIMYDDDDKEELLKNEIMPLLIQESGEEISDISEDEDENENEHILSNDESNLETPPFDAIAKLHEDSNDEYVRYEDNKKRKRNQGTNEISKTLLSKENVEFLRRQKEYYNNVIDKHILHIE